MKVCRFFLLFSFITSFSFGQRFWVASTPGNWNNTANWSATSGGAGGASVPGPADLVTFNGAGGSNGNCTLDIAPNVAGITINGYTGTIDLSGFNLTTTGTNIFTSGTVNNSGGPAAVTLNTTVSTTFNGTLFNANVNGTTGRIFFNGSVFNGLVNVTKTDNNNDNSTGNNIFNGVTTITNLGGGQILLGNGARDQFNALTTFNNNGSFRFYFAFSHAAQTTTFASDLILNTNKSGGADAWSFLVAEGANTSVSFGGNLTINCGGTLQSNHRILQGAGSQATYSGTVTVNLTNTHPATSVSLGTNGTSIYNGNIQLSNTGGASGIFFNTTASASSSLNAPAAISIGAGGFSSGTLSLLRFAQVGLISQTLNNFSGNSRLDLGPASSFDGDVNFSAPNLFLNGCTFAATATIEKTGGGNNNSTGGNTFGSTTAITNSGTGQLLLANTQPDIFNGNLTVNNSSNSIIYLAHNSPGNQFNGNIILNATAGGGIRFCDAANGTATMSAGNTISLGGSGFLAGDLHIRRFTQLGNIPVILNLSPLSNILRVGPSTAFGGNADLRAPRIFLDGTDFSGTALIEKLGASTDTGLGNNIFNATTTLLNSGTGSLRTNGNNTFNGSVSIINSATGDILLENTSGSIYNGDVTLNNTGNSSIRVAFQGASSFNGNIVVNNTSGTGIFFCESAGATATLAATRTLSVGGSGFTTGSLNLPRFTQIGATPQNINLTGIAFLRVGPASSFDGDVSFNSPQIELNGATYNGAAFFQKTGATGNNSQGGNTFNGVSTIANSGSGDFLLANNNPDVFNGNLTVTNTGSRWIFLAHNVAGNQFNGDITLNNSGSALGIIFSNSVNGSSTFTGANITVGGGGFSTGELRLLRFTQTGIVPKNLTLSGSTLLTIGPNSSFDANVDFRAPGLLLNGANYNGTARLEKTSVGNNDGAGGNTFVGEATLVNSGDSYLATANTNPDIFNDKLIIINSGASTVRLANNSPGNQFNGNIELNSTFGGGIWFGNGANGTGTLAATRTIGVGMLGVISGDVRLIRFTQVGATAQALTLTGIATLTLGPTSGFGGDVNFTAPNLLLNGTTFSGTATLEKNGPNNDLGAGGNTFSSTATLIHSGSGQLITANSAPDLFNGNLTVTNTGSNIVFLAHNVPGTVFNGNITFNSTLGSGGIYFANNPTGDATLNAGGSLLVGGLGFSSGNLRFRRFTQLGANPQTLLLTGTGLLELGPNSTFNGNIDFRAPQFELDGATFQGITRLEKTGAVNNDSQGNNIFNGLTTIVNSGSGYFRFAVSALDQFNNDLTLENTGTSTIRMAEIIPGTVFNGNIQVNSTNGGGILFAVNAASNATLAAGRNISVGASGFSIGDLQLNRFIQVGATPQNLILTGTALLTIGPGSSFGGNVNFRAPQLLLSGGTFNGTATLEKTGAGNSTGAGNNIFNSTATIINSGTNVLRTNGNNTFNGTTTLINSGSNDLLLELVNGSIYNGNLTLTNTGTSYIRAAYLGSTAFNGNIFVNSTNGIGVYFVENTLGSATLAAGQTIAVGGTGFSFGELRIQRFTQVGATPQTLTLTGAATFRSAANATWNGDLTVTSPRVFLDGSTFNGTTTITKTNSVSDVSVGGNTFNGSTVLTNNNTGIFRLGNTNSDVFAGDVTFNQSSGSLEPTYNSVSTFRGNVSVNGNSAITFGANVGTASFEGGNNQSINRLGSANPVFRRLQMNKGGNSVTLNTPISISTSATFISGVVNSTAINVFTFNDNAVSIGGSNASHVDGPVVKIGNDPFSFPTGDNGIFRTIAMSAPTNTAHAFTAQYFFAAQAFGGVATYDPSFATVSACEYWTLDRTSGTSNVNVTLSWVSSDCSGIYISDLPSLRVTRWNGSNWVDHGNGGTTGNTAVGTVTTSAPITSFSPITLASTSFANPLPVELVSFSVVPIENVVSLRWTTASELNNDFFTVQRSVNGVEFSGITEVTGAGTTAATTHYEYIDQSPLQGISYYRLKQTDFDGTTAFSEIIRIDRDRPLVLIMYPNPVKLSHAVRLSFISDFIVLNSLGQQVMEVKNSNEINTSGLIPGVYIVRSGLGHVQRLVVN